MDKNTLERCKNIENMVKHLSNTQIEELFKILQNNKCNYTINNNGVFLNLSWISEPILVQIELFISFCAKSKSELDRYEQICRDLNDNLEIKRIEHDFEMAPAEAEEKIIEISKRLAPKMSSSMKFYFLKKKFSKSVPVSSLVKNNELTKDTPILSL